MNQLLRDIKTNFDSEDFESASALCQKALEHSVDDQQKLVILSFLGPSHLQLGQIEKGEDALVQATKISCIQPHQLQKIYKTLSDHYEKLEKWESMAQVSMNLFDMVVQKENWDRATALAFLIVDAYLKLSASATLVVLHTAGKFIERYILLMRDGAEWRASPEQIISMLFNLSTIQTAFVDATKRTAAKSMYSQYFIKLLAPAHRISVSNVQLPFQPLTLFTPYAVHTHSNLSCPNDCFTIPPSLPSPLPSHLPFLSYSFSPTQFTILTAPHCLALVSTR